MIKHKSGLTRMIAAFSAVCAGIAFMVSLFYESPFTALLMAVLYGALTMLLLKILLDVSAARTRNRLSAISEDIVWWDIAILVGAGTAFAAQGILALTEERMHFLPARERLPKEAVPIAHIAQLNRRVHQGGRFIEAFVNLADGRTLRLALSAETYHAFLEALTRLRPSLSQGL